MKKIFDYIPLNDSKELFIIRMKLILFSLGMSEKYMSFNYLTDIILYLILSKEDDFQYKFAIKYVQEKYCLTERTIMSGLHQIIQSCNQTIFNQKQSLSSINGLLNKIRTIKNYVLSKLSDCM